MYGNARILQRQNMFTVPTKHDKRRLVMITVSGHRVLVSVRDETFHDIVKGRSVEVTYPAGTGFLFHGEQGIYQVFPGGMYHMLRAKTHASHGEREDAKEMRGMQQLTFDFISRLRTWMLIGDEGRGFTDSSLAALAAQLDHPKRDEHKLSASRHYRKASELRTRHDKRMPMPAAFTASAGAKQLDLRRADVRAILGWIDPERVRVFGLIEGVHARLDDAWRIFSPQAFAQPGHPVALAAAKPTTQSIKVMRDRLRPVYAGLKEIRVRPLNGVAREAVVMLATLRDKIMDASSPPDIRDEISAIRASLTIMQVVRELETDVITPLSMLLARWKRIEPPRHGLVRTRVADACLSFGTGFTSRAEFLPPKLSMDVMEHVRHASLVANQDDDEPRKRLLAAKRTLKRLSDTLA